MKLLGIIVLFTLCLVARGWVVALQPLIPLLGASFVAMNIDSDLIPDIQPIAWRKWLTFKMEEEDEKDIYDGRDPEKVEQDNVVEAVENEMPEEDELSEKGKYQRTKYIQILDSLKTYAKKTFGEPIGEPDPDPDFDAELDRLEAKYGIHTGKKFPDNIYTDLDVHNMKRLGDFEEEISFQRVDSDFADGYIYEF